MKLSPTLLISSLCLALGSAASAQSFVFNGDFEQNVYSPDYYTAGGGQNHWTFFGPVNESGVVNGNAGLTTPNTGSQYALIGGYNSFGPGTFVLRTIFSIPTAATYELRWADSLANSGGPLSGNVQVSITAQIGAVVVYSGTFDAGEGAGPGVWHSRSVLVSLTGGGGITTSSLSPSILVWPIEELTPCH